MEHKTVKGLIKYFETQPQEIRKYYLHLPSLLSSLPFDIALSYLFARLESAQLMIVYAGLVKLHRCEKDLTWTAIQIWHFTREEFITKFATVFGKDIDTSTRDRIKQAEKVRDNIMHGKRVSEAQKREAIADILDYSNTLGSQVKTLSGFHPFGELRGFKGATSPLDKSTTRWILKGMGFSL